MSDDSALAMAALWAASHNTRILVNRGLASAQDVDEVYSSIMEALETMGSPQLQEAVRRSAEPVFADLRRIAQGRFGELRKDQP